MTALLDPRTADKLTKLLGMLGSAHDGERASAAALADKLVRSQGLTWPEVIASRSSCSTVEEQVGLALANLDALSMWERGFIYTVNGQTKLSPKQRAVLDRIERKVRAYRDGGCA
jgi:hypothetical protein